MKGSFLNFKILYLWTESDISPVYLIFRRHVLLTELSRKYGPVMGLKFGSLPVVVLGSAEVVKEAFVDNEDCYGRPEMMPAINKLFIKDGRKRGIIQNGDQWWINRTITGRSKGAVSKFGKQPSLVTEPLIVLFRCSLVGISSLKYFVKTFFELSQAKILINDIFMGKPFV